MTLARACPDTTKVNSRYSLRMQIAIALGIALAVGFSLNTFFALKLMGRALQLAYTGKPVTWANSLLVVYCFVGWLLTFFFGVSLLSRMVIQSLDHLVRATERIGRMELDDPLKGSGASYGDLGIAFEKMTQNLKYEHARAAAQIAELENLNRQLAEARDSLARSEKSATVGRLAAGVAHEIGNPLGAILGYLELAKMHATTESKEYLQRIDNEVARIDRTVRELLNFSRPGPTVGVLEAVPLRQAVESAVHLSSAQKRLRNVEFDIQVPNDFQVLAERHHLSQILVNLLLNAGDAMKGEGRIEIKATCFQVGPGKRASDPPPGPRIEVQVVDMGSGIDPGDLSRVFDPFFTTKEPGEGTGLGLSVCHRFMETFGGEIYAANRVANNRTKGAVFTMIFRQAVAEQSSSSF